MKFKYKDRVKITSGFYEGCIGIVTDIQENGENQWDEYQVIGSNPDYQFDDGFTAWIKENVLEKL